MQSLNYRLKSLILRLSGLEDKIIILLPPADNINPDGNDENRDPLVTPSLSNLSTGSSRSTFSGSEGSIQNNSNHNTTTITNSKGIPKGIDTTQEPTWSLMMIIPGAYMDPQDYYAIASVIQQQAWKKFHTKLVVAIGLDMTKEVYTKNLTKWVLNEGDPRILINLIQGKAEEQLVQQQQKYGRFLSASNNPTRIQRVEKMYNIYSSGTIFQDMFLFGHSMGGLIAISTAYPSKFRAVMTYGCAMTYSSASTVPPPHTLLSSYPKPELTILGERDGNMRYYLVAEEAKALEDDMQQKIHCSRNHPADIKRVSRLRKLIIVLPQLNHMQMANDRLPVESVRTGRSDFSSRIPLEEAHMAVARVVVDFMHVHSSRNGSGTMTLQHRKKTMVAPTDSPRDNGTCTSSRSRSRSNSVTTSRSATVRAQDRLLQLGKITHTVYLQPWLLLSDRSYQSQFLCDLQRQILHITTGGDDANFYEDENPEESSHEEHTTPDIIPNWHLQPNDFLYSKARWDSECDQITMEIVEQDPIAVSLVKQLSKTLAFKGRSQEDILFNQNKYQAIKDSPVPTLMELNRRTFAQVLNHVVTSHQRRRYVQDGRKLRFGPDILVQDPPSWVTMPISITKQGDGDEPRVPKSISAKSTNSVSNNDNDSYYLWQSPYATTPTSKPAPFGGAWYGKPLSPAQAYEWIVFDAFKPFPSN